MEMIFHSHANKTHFQMKGCALGLTLKVSVVGTWKWPITSMLLIYFLHHCLSLAEWQANRKSNREVCGVHH